MAATQATVLVLRRITFSETSLVLTLFSREVGKFQALAKGARRPKSSFEGGFDLLGVYRIVFLPKSGETLQLVTEGKLLERFRPEQAGVRGLFAAYYLVELLDSFTAEMGPQPEVFDLSVVSLRRLQQEPFPELTTLRFEVGLLKALGHLGRFDVCSFCGGVIPWGEPAKLTEIAGGLLCSRCLQPHHRGLTLTGPERKILHVLGVEIENAIGRETSWMRGSPKSLEPVSDGPIASPVTREDRLQESLGHSEICSLSEELSNLYPRIRGLVSHWICHFLGRRPRLFPYLEKLGFFRKEPKPGSLANKYGGRPSG